MTTDIRRISIPKGKRIIAVSDVHAHRQLFIDLLEKVGFCRDDELFIVGDLLARGPESLSTLRYMMELDKLENVHVMMGNMEYWHYSLLQDNIPDGHYHLRKQILGHMEEFGHNFFADMLDELGLPVSDGLNIAEAAEAIKSAFEEELDYIRSLPAIIETDHLIFVHGGIPSEDLELFRDLDPHQFLKNDRFMSKREGMSFSKYVIVGHWPVTNYYRDHICHMPFVNREQRLISIDGGCGVKHGAQLNAFIISDESRMEYSVSYCDGLPVRTAAESQAESESFVNIRFGDHAVDILERGVAESYVRHLSTGSTLWVPNGDIWYENDSACCIHTDYLLPVREGDSLSICLETNKGCMVKKNGLCGWYRGAFH